MTSSSPLVWFVEAVRDVATARATLAADPALANHEGGPHRWPPLLYAAFSRLHGGGLDVVRLLLARGADPNAGYLPDGEPPPVAALAGHLDMARLLVALGADPAAEAVDDGTPGQFSPAGPDAGGVGALQRPAPRGRLAVQPHGVNATTGAAAAYAMSTAVDEGVRFGCRPSRSSRASACPRSTGTPTC